MSLHQRTKHPEYVEGCFGCKVSTLELNTGDAGRPIADKQWQSRLKFYKDARPKTAGASRASISS